MAKRKREKIRIFQQAEKKRSPVQYQLPVYPVGLDKRAIVLCVPDHVNFTIALQTALAHFEYQPNWVGPLGEDRERFRSDWVGMVANMQCIDLTALEEYTERIAIAMESIDNKTPTLVSLQDILANPELYFAAEILASIAPLLDIARYITSFFPEIKIDPFKVVTWVTAMMRHTQLIAALGLISTAIAALGAAQGMETLVGLITGGANYLFKMQDAFTQMRDDIIGTVTSFWSQPVDDIDTNFTEVDYTDHWLGQNAILAEMAAHMDKSNALKREHNECVCNNLGCCRCGGGVVLDPETITQGAGPPAGFADCPEWEVYKCNAANWLTDRLVQIATRIDEMPHSLREFERSASEGGTFSIGQLNTQVGNFVFTTFDPLWLANMTAANLGYLTTVATQWAASWLDDVSNSYPEESLATIQDRWFYTPMSNLIAALSTDKNATTQALFDTAMDTDQTMNTLNSWITTALANAIGMQDEHTDFFGGAVTKAVSNLLWVPVDAIAEYTASIPCSGNTGCNGPPAGLGTCYAVQGSWSSAPNIWDSQYVAFSVGQIYTIGDHKLTNVSWTGGGPTDPPSSGQTMYVLNDTLGETIYSSDVPPTDLSGEYGGILFRGETPFQFHLSFTCEPL